MFCTKRATSTDQPAVFDDALIANSLRLVCTIDVYSEEGYVAGTHILL